MSKRISSLGQMEVEGVRHDIIARYEIEWYEANMPAVVPWMRRNDIVAALILKRPYAKTNRGYTAYLKKDGSTYPAITKWEGQASL